MDEVRGQARRLLRRAGVWLNTPGVEVVERLAKHGDHTIYRYTTWIIQVRIDAVVSCGHAGCELLGASIREPTGRARVWQPGLGWSDGNPGRILEGVMA
ncbi:MAG: hypothetical protein GSR80_000619 [Desulfurococcales archaeon]|nr:hypothetical protein [Desulfurococcales archaeon]